MKICTPPLSARLNIYHSLVQSHINYCSLIWGFTTKSNIESIFAIQKKGIRTVIPGFVNYFYRDGTIPHHTKEAFTKYDILTVHNIKAKNALVFMYKHYRNDETRALPNSVASTIYSSIVMHRNPDLRKRHAKNGTKYTARVISDRRYFINVFRYHGEIWPYKNWH